MQPTVFSIAGVQIAKARKVSISGRTILSAIHKQPVQGPVTVGALGLAGDEQADLSVHGGLDKAVYAYPSEHYAFWHKARQQAGVTGLDPELPAGALGENLTLSGLLETSAWLGDVLEFAHCRLRITAPREPCFKFNAAMGFNKATRLMAQTGFCGFYLSVDAPGHVQAGETFRLQPGPRRVSVPESFKAKMFKHLRD